MNINGYQNQDFRTIPSLWPNLEGVTILDIGCGVGLYSNALVQRGARVIGVDFERENLRLAQKNDTTGLGVWVCADARHLPFKETSFAMVISVEVLTHLPPDAMRCVILEMARVAVDGAAVYLTLHNKTRLDLRAWVGGRTPTPFYQTSNLDVWPARLDDALDMVRDCGLELVTRPRYLNFYSRFSMSFVCKYPFVARCLAALEEILSRLPILRRVAITFLLQLYRDRS